MKLLTGVLLAATLLLGCKKDDDNNSKTKNYFKVGDTEYDLSAGILENYGTDDNNSWHYGFNTDLTLYSEGLTLQAEDDDWELVGEGHGIYFELFSTTGNALDTEDYVFTLTEPCPIGTFDDGGCTINYDSEQEENSDEEDFDFAGGTVSVSKSGNEYTITIDCTSENGKRITGFYKGTLRYFDWSVGDKSASLKSIKIKNIKLRD